MVAVFGEVLAKETVGSDLLWSGSELHIYLGMICLPITQIYTLSLYKLIYT